MNKQDIADNKEIDRLMKEVRLLSRKWTKRKPAPKISPIDTDYDLYQNRSNPARFKRHVREDSEVIRAIDYDKQQNTMWVVFKNGSTYRYERVSERHYAKFANAPSWGSFYHKYVRGNGTSNRVQPPSDKQQKGRKTL